MPRFSVRLTRNTDLDRSLNEIQSEIERRDIIVEQSDTGETTGFSVGSGTGVNDDSSFTGNKGTTAYTISDIVKALKENGILKV